MKCSHYLLFIVLLLTHPLFAQDPVADSLKNALATAPADTNRVNLLFTLAKSSMATSPTEALDYSEQMLKLSEQLKFSKGVAQGYKWLGIAKFNLGNYFDAIQNYEKAQAVFDSIGDRRGVANMYSNIGNVYYNQGEDSKALEYFLQSLKISEEINDTLRTTTALINIGAVFANKSITYPQALKYLGRALPLSLAIDDLTTYGTACVNIGEIWLNSNEYDSAQVYFEKAAKAYDGTEDLPYALNDLGKVYQMRQEYDAAYRYQKQAYDIAKSLDLRNDMAISMLGIAKTLQLRGETRTALNAYLEAESLAKETNSNYSLKEIYEGLSGVYARLGDFTKAFKYQNLLIGVKDTLYNIDTDKKLQGLTFNFEIEKKQGQIDLLTKDQKLQQAEIRRQRLVKNGFIGGFAVVLLFAGVFFSQRNRISREKKRSDELLLNILPEETAEELKATGTAKARNFDSVTVMFTDFKNFTQASERLSPEELVREINDCYSEFDRIVSRYGIEKIKTIGDAYMCAGGLPVPNGTHPVDVIKAGLEFQAFIEQNKQKRISQGLPYFELRLGIHTGPVVAGIVGIKKFAYDIWGDTVNTASRMESSGATGKVNISGTTYELVKDHFDCTPRGKVEAKNKGWIEMYFVEGLK
ncbi:MAG: adenylate/guanylate cyclase domain-containing protein [Bacteroidota bacterium]|jgi:class 3 adenylate cyclase|uniref:adenylate/guanylate cyclase domain-containing protein n=1 Tax=Candidatus Pollutiaquabacter sp. TaxID=3416354 RepID=UPI001A36C07B|nr:tetratricopeptide repeat protein [Bacteroidota bacterium]MBL7949055.1 tetratricopeptide repeat protein [Bacteroidia bacterium]MBP6009882.1 tetratricopeptide repeat protein [Bacteroidia bacterium]MBP7269449.1 tetratricopeptide repeat protein [Bacteroidia bacterium]MBP7436927.1 tetratricopeptide repeat protein [Bacteroidia bacterium]